MPNSYLQSVIKQFTYYKKLGDGTFVQLTDDEIFKSSDSEVNSIAIIAKHMVGNMLSRWTNFLTEDGEKSWRQRDDEFVNSYQNKSDMIVAWKKGWACLFDALNSIDETQLEDLIYIRNQGHTITEAINRQLSHYSYHVGQLVFIGKMIKGKNWQSLSIPKNTSESYNKQKFDLDKERKHFTEDL